MKWPTERKTEVVRDRVGKVAGDGTRTPAIAQKAGRERGKEAVEETGRDVRSRCCSGIGNSGGGRCRSNKYISIGKPSANSRFHKSGRRHSAFQGGY